ncbi:nuclear transport factor 2 family protein [Streptomyces regalis]|uniref:nuclear transport factor 2 family protein n=1 Tax=Streptomyces regalis TaxID=68262 RepID=UPI000D14FD4C
MRCATRPPRPVRHGQEPGDLHACDQYGQHRKRDGALGPRCGRRARAELYDTGDVAGADEVFAPDVIDYNPAAGAAPSGIDGMRALVAAVRDGFTERSTGSCSSRSFRAAGWSSTGG